MKSVVNVAVLAAVLQGSTALASYPPAPVNMFVSGTPWTKNVASAAVSSSSAAIIGAIRDSGGWGGSGLFRTDFSIKVMKKLSTTPMQSFTTTSDFWSPDCDHVSVPIPSGGSIEGNSGYTCSNNGDCHLIVHDAATNKLYEMWRANRTSSTSFRGGCLAVWNTADDYSDGQGRGLSCTSADAAGLPIAPLLFTADEIYNNNIPHAIRFILPNDRIRRNAYVAPGTHATGAASGGSSHPPYGTRLRLKANFDMTRIPSAAGRTVAKALQTYGMILADGGKVALTAAHDAFTSKKWANVGFTSSSLDAIKIDDFEVVDFGTVRTQGSCVRA